MVVWYTKRWKHSDVWQCCQFLIYDKSGAAVCFIVMYKAVDCWYKLIEIFIIILLQFIYNPT